MRLRILYRQASMHLVSSSYSVSLALICQASALICQGSWSFICKDKKVKAKCEELDILPA